MQATKTIPSPVRGTQSGGKDPRSPLVISLAVLLGLQLLAALVMGLSGADLSPAGPRGALLDFEQAQVTRIRIEGRKQGPLVLERRDETWLIPALDDFPTAAIKVTNLLNKLGGIQRRIPVATSESAIRRFRVADEGFERKVALEGQDGPLGTLYLGDSPGFRRLFVRADGEQAVYEAGLALFEASDKADDWISKTALLLEQRDIQAIELGDIALERGDEGWVLSDPGTDETLDQGAVDALVHTLANLDYRSVLGEKDMPEYGQDSPVLTFRITLGAETLEYRLSALAEDENGFILTVSNQPYAFRQTGLGAGDLIAVKRSDLIEGGSTGEDAEPGPEATEETTGPGPDDP